MSLGPSSFLLACSLFIAHPCGSRSREGKRVSQKRHRWQQPPATGTTGTHLRHSFPDLLGWWHQLRMDWKPAGVPSLLQHRAGSVTPAPTHFRAAWSQLSGKAELCSRHDSKEHLPDSCALKGILFCLPLLHYFFPCVRSRVCRLSCNSNCGLDCTFSSNTLIHQHCSNSKLHPAQLTRDLCILLAERWQMRASKTSVAGGGRRSVNRKQPCTWGTGSVSEVHRYRGILLHRMFTPRASWSLHQHVWGSLFSRHGTGEGSHHQKPAWMQIAGRQPIPLLWTLRQKARWQICFPFLLHRERCLQFIVPCIKMDSSFLLESRADFLAMRSKTLQFKWVESACLSWLIMCALNGLHQEKLRLNRTLHVWMMQVSACAHQTWELQWPDGPPFVPSGQG